MRKRALLACIFIKKWTLIQLICQDFAHFYLINWRYNICFKCFFVLATFPRLDKENVETTWHLG